MSTVEDDCMCDAEKAVQKGIDKRTGKQASVLSQSIYDKNVLSPAELAQISAAKDASKPKGIVSKCSGTAPFKLEDMEVEKVLVEYRFKPSKTEKKEKLEKKKILETPKKLTVCESLKLAGFQSDWTKEKISRMIQTPDGAQLLEKVDMEFRQLSGKSSLSELDILSCFPNYLKKEKRNVELVVELDSDEKILSVSEKNDNNAKKEKKKSKFSI